MFPSSPLDKSCAGFDNCSSGHNNASRFPVGITSLGDENQQIRIQSAVHKYNSSGNNSLSNKCALSPVRHSFLKNSLKAKNYEGDTDGTLKNEKKNGNHYEGVGAFPTIHLRKSAIRYRPIRKFNDVKIPYSELPINRFLSHTPEVCPDMKSSTRSVLDVLEDFSGKKMHVKDSNGSNKPQSKGLGGDYILNPNAVYKPLFIQKPKISSVLTRDNTTQTLSPFDRETSSSQINNSFVKNDVSDSRAELRRKLAKQNNEIFASLSSSIASSFSLKRKIDKVLYNREGENLVEGSASKKSKISDQLKNCSENSASKSLGWCKTSSVGLVKLNKKNAKKEMNSPTSPNKDRLTTIFLDMQNTSPEVQIFNSNSLPTDVKFIENNSQAHIVKGVENKTASSVVNDSSRTNRINITKSESALENSSNLGSTEKVTPLNSKNQENGLSCKPIFDFRVSKSEAIPNENLISISTALNLGVNVSNTLNFSIPRTSELIQIKNVSSLNENIQNTSYGCNSDKKDRNNQVLSNSFTSESTSDKPDYNSFKFGMERNASGLNVSQKDPKSHEALSLSVSTPPSSAPQFSLGATTSVTSTYQTSTLEFSTASTQDSLTTPTKALFSFGCSTSHSQQSPSKIEEKDKISNGLPSLIAVTTENVGPQSTKTESQFSTHNVQESGVDSPIKTMEEQNVTSMIRPTSETGTINFSSVVTNLSTNTVPAAESEKNIFTFGQKTPVTFVASTATTQNPKFPLSQISDSEQNKEQKLFEQKNSNLFSFGQKPESILSSQNQSTSSQLTSIFGRNSPTTSTAPITFEKTSSPQISDAFKAKSEAESLNNFSASVFNQSNTNFPIKTSLFGPPASELGNTTTQATICFGTSTSNALSFGSPATTRPTAAFEVSSSSQTVTSFGTSVTSQSKSEFGNTSSTQPTTAFETTTPNSTSIFRVSATTQSACFGVSTPQSGLNFGDKSTPQSIYTFGTSSSSQSTSSFDISSTKQPPSVFGTSTSHSVPCFGTPPNQTTHTFGTAAGFKVSSSSQPTSMFPVPASSPSAIKFGAATTQSNSSFGTTPGFSTSSSSSSSSIQPNTAFGTPIVTSTSLFGTIPSSFSQTFGNKPTSSLGQMANIFGQNTMPSLSSSNAFSSNQNNAFVAKPNTEKSMFDQNKTQTSVFGTSTQPFGTQSKFSFGMSTSNVTGFTTSPPTTTAAPAFSFGNCTTENTFTFSNTSGSNNTFAFKSPTSEPFKFGAVTTKEGSGFGGTSTTTFTFGGGQMNNNSMTESKPAFNFGSTQISSSAPFNFGTTPSSSVFSFGSSAGSGSGFSFGALTPTPGVSFGQTSTPSPATPFAVPGTFCIGSGSSQSRPRATSRPRRRP